MHTAGQKPCRDPDKRWSVVALPRWGLLLGLLGAGLGGSFFTFLAYLNSKKQTTDPKTQKREASPKTGAGGLQNLGINFRPESRICYL